MLIMNGKGMGKINKVPRMIFNFNDHCLYGCRFCFTPFDNLGLGDVSLWKDILNKINEFSPDLLSFSGCDPFAYEGFYELLEDYEKKQYISVDSALLDFNAEKFGKIADKIDAIAFPIDDCDSMTKRQRFDGESYKKIFANVETIKKFGVNLSAHTLLTPLNIDYIEKIGEILIVLGVKNWTIYQFWGYDFIKDKQEFELDDNVYLSRCRQVKDKYGIKINIKYELQKDRKDSKFFVSSIGRCYTTGNNGSHLYFGSIFDDDIYSKWKECCDVCKSAKETSEKIRIECMRGEL